MLLHYFRLWILLSGFFLHEARDDLLLLHFLAELGLNLHQLLQRNVTLMLHGLIFGVLTKLLVSCALFVLEPLRLLVQWYALD